MSKTENSRLLAPLKKILLAFHNIIQKIYRVFMSRIAVASLYTPHNVYKSERCAVFYLRCHFFQNRNVKF